MTVFVLNVGVGFLIDLVGNIVVEIDIVVDGILYLFLFV